MTWERTFGQDTDGCWGFLYVLGVDDVTLMTSFSSFSVNAVSVFTNRFRNILKSYLLVNMSRLLGHVSCSWRTLLTLNLSSNWFLRILTPFNHSACLIFMWFQNRDLQSLFSFFFPILLYSCYGFVNKICRVRRL
jgi:hypothetical protein